MTAIDPLLAARAEPEEINPLAARVLLFLCRHPVPVLSRLWRIVLNCDIYCDLRRRTVLMPHPYGIVIHSLAQVGNGVVIMQHVTLGGRLPGRNEAPVIEDNVYLGAGARVLGAVRIGRGAVVGANAVVTRDVPAGATVVGFNRILEVPGIPLPERPDMQIDQPKISIVTCSYQQGRYLDATMRSVLDQAYPDLEYIVIDGGSSDQSTAVIRAHEHQLAYWVSEPDRGQTDALIKGFSRATGEICGWLCSDDLLLPGALQKVADFFAAHPDVAAVYGDALWIDAAGGYIRPKREMGFSRFVFLFDHNYIAQPSMFWRRGLYERVRGLDRDFNLAMDADLWERFSRHTRITHLPEYLSCMRYYPEQKTRAMRPQGRIEDARIRARSALARLPGATPVLQRLARLQRVLAKGLAGGYWGGPPAGQLRALERYRIEGGSA